MAKAPLQAEGAQVEPPLVERRAEVVAPRDRAGERKQAVDDAVVTTGHPTKLALEVVERCPIGHEVQAMLGNASVRQRGCPSSQCSKPDPGP